MDQIDAFQTSQLPCGNLDYEGLSIYSTNVYQGVNIPISGNQSIARIVRAGGLPALQGYIAHNKTPPPPWDYRRVLGIALL